MSDVTIGQRLSEAQPNPMTMKSCESYEQGANIHLVLIKSKVCDT